MEKNVRVRFAPSPTGDLHVGNARTALFNYLLARHLDGTFVLRIEDTDRERSTEESERAILHDLRWLGLEWDEGPVKGGEFGPYRQSERAGKYLEAAERLRRSDRAYYCFCTPELLEQERRRIMEAGGTPRYDGRCRQLDPREAESRVAGGESAALRFTVEGGDVSFVDLVRGQVSFDASQFGDFVILRSNGVPAYNFAVVVDDGGMKISHVVRGEDHLTNTPKQFLLYRELELTPPRFAHLPMILGPDHSRLSKRHGATSVRQCREDGFSAPALTNFLALLGWSPGDDREILSHEELVRSFTLDRVSKSASIFNVEKLSWMNGAYLRATPAEDLWREVGHHFTAAGFIPDSALPEMKDKLVEIVDLLKSKVKTVKEMAEYGALFFRDDPGYSAEAKEKLAEPEARLVLEALLEVVDENVHYRPEDVRQILKAIQKKLKIGGKILYPAIRLAVSGQEHGPELDRLFCLIGAPLVRARLQKVLTPGSE